MVRRPPAVDSNREAAVGGRRSALALLAQGVAAAAVLFACTSHGSPVPTPPPGLFDTTTQSTLDYANVDLSKVAGRTTLTVPLGPGGATLSGSVIGPDGAVPGATVRIERVVGEAIGSMNVTTQADGTWTLPGLLGGQFRVRAWRAPDLADTDPAVSYVGATDTQQVTLRLVKFGGTQVNAALAPDPPIIGEPAQLVVQVTSSSVDADGVVRAAAKPHSVVQLFGQGRWQVTSSASATTGRDGTVSWQLTCAQLGPQPLSVVVDSADVFPLTLSACAPVPTTTTTSTLPSASTTTGSTTSTTRRFP